MIRSNRFEYMTFQVSFIYFHLNLFVFIRIIRIELNIRFSSNAVKSDYSLLF